MLAGWREEEARKQGAREASRPGGGRVRDFARKAGELAPQCSKKNLTRKEKIFAIFSFSLEVRITSGSSNQSA
jgi:hypothetical protein